MQNLRTIETTDEFENTTQEENRTLPLSLSPLGSLSWNYWWTWSPDGPSIFRDLDPEIWEEYEHNPRLLLAKTSEYRLAQMATDPGYVDRVRRLAEEFDNYMGVTEAWSPREGPSKITPE